MIIAIDVGGTKTLIARFEGKEQISREERFPTPHDQQVFLRELLEWLQHFELERATAICIAVPGLIDAEGSVLRCGNLPWKDFPLRKLLAEATGKTVLINNDAKLAGLAETLRLPTIPPLSVYTTISTGIGTGIIVNGRLDPALDRSEGGHMILQTTQGYKEWEDFASGHAIREQFHKMAADITSDADWKKIVDQLVVGFQALIPLLQPEVIIIGGSIGSYFDRYAELLRQELRTRLTDYIDLPEIRQARHPQEAVVYGCYDYAIHQGAGRAT